MQKYFISILGCLSIMLFTCGCSMPWTVSDQPSDSDSDQSQKSVGQEMYFAELSIDGTVIRDDGQGTCGIQPWMGDCTTYRRWWGQTLTAAFNTELIIVPDGEDRWVITNNEDVLKKYTFLPKELSVYNNPDSGHYSLATPAIDFGSTMGCDGAITMSVKNFNTQVMGVARYGYVSLTISPQAVEHIFGKCGKIDFDQETTTWRWGVSAALAKDPEDMTIVLGEEEFFPIGSEEIKTAEKDQASYYRKIAEKSTNPSPQNRDHVEASLWFFCKDANDKRVECPWNK